FGEKNVLRLQVAVDDALVVGRRQSLGDLRRIIGSLARRQWAVFQLSAQARALQKFRDNEGRSTLLPNIVYGENVGMIECSHRARLLLKAPQPVGIARKR